MEASFMATQSPETTSACDEIRVLETKTLTSGKNAPEVFPSTVCETANPMITFFPVSDLQSGNSSSDLDHLVGRKFARGYEDGDLCAAVPPRNRGSVRSDRLGDDDVPKGVHTATAPSATGAVPTVHSLRGGREGTCSGYDESEDRHESEDSMPTAAPPLMTPAHRLLPSCDFSSLDSKPKRSGAPSSSHHDHR